MLSGQEVFHQFIVAKADHAQWRDEVAGIVIDEAFGRTFDGGVVSAFKASMEASRVEILGERVRALGIVVEGGEEGPSG